MGQFQTPATKYFALALPGSVKLAGWGPTNSGASQNGSLFERASPTMAECFHFDFVAMGSPCSLDLYAPDIESADETAAQAMAEVHRIELKYSLYRSESYLAEINAAAKSGECIFVDSETSDLIDHAFRAFALSNGLFDVTCSVLREIWNDTLSAPPRKALIASLLQRVGLEKVIWARPQLSFTVPGMELDFGGIAKEYAADQAVFICRTRGLSSGLINLGGDVAVIGKHPDDAPWRIGITDPFGSGTALATLFVSSGGIATSGTYERYRELSGRRYSHIICPKTGWPVEGLPSVTVISETCLEAGMYSTLALLMEENAQSWLCTAGVDYAYIDVDGMLRGSIFSSART